jgi:hypothetical protein
MKNFQILCFVIILIFNIFPGKAALAGLKVSDSGRYFVTTEGKPFFMVGRQINYTWGDFWQLYEQNNPRAVESYFSNLSKKGINTLRMFVEDLFPGHDYYFEQDVKTGALNTRSANFLRKIIELGNKYGIYIILSPWETFYMGDGDDWYQRWRENPYFTSGIIESPADFYRVDNPNGLNEAQKRRLSSLLGLIGSHQNVIIELINEIDGQWQMPYIHTNDSGAPWRATWFPQVVQPWMEMMRDHLRNAGFSGLLSFSTSVEFPSLPEEQDFLFRLPGFDFLLFHPYFLDQSACTNWPCNLLQDWPEYEVFCHHGVRCAADPGRCNQPANNCGAEHVQIQPARDMRDAARFAYMFGNRPYVDGEDGPLFRDGYDADFNKNDDIEAFRNQQWANLAAGAAASGIRHPQGVMEGNNSLLWSEMDDIQGTIGHFITTGAVIDFNQFEAQPIDQDVSLEINNQAVEKIGVKDQQNQAAILFLLVDKQKTSNSNIGNTNIAVKGLLANKSYRIEHWKTNGFNVSPLTITDLKTGADGVVNFRHNLNGSAAFKITSRQPNRNDGSLITSQLAIGASIHTEEKGPLNTVWQEGGRSTTSRGDVVVWGHLYAPPSEVSWGNQNNPDAYVKIWFDASGRVDVNFFHVSVPDINASSALKSSQSWTASGDITVSTRYLRQEYHLAVPSINNSNGTGNRSTEGYQISEQLHLEAEFYPGSNESFPAAWREGGRAFTQRGDQVIWGFFYADSSDRDWGNAENPDLYVKIWYDISGRVDVNFFHVSVPDIQVKSTFSGQQNSSVVTLAERYQRHEYQVP